MKIAELFEAQNDTLEIDWTIPKSCIQSVNRGEQVEIWVDPKKVDPSFAKDTNFYVGANGTGAAIGKRYNNFGKWLTYDPTTLGHKRKPDEAVEMPEIVIFNGEIRFSNGRHRYAWVRDHGAKALPVIADKGDEKLIKQKFGATNHKTIVKLDQ